LIGGSAQAPKLTIGDGSQLDTSLVFDGNAQDYYIGLDDTDDDLKIGLGSTVGTTAHMVFDAIGAVTMPLQVSFSALPSGTLLTITGDSTAYTFILASERWDQNADWDGTSTFTAPVTGKYLFTGGIFWGNATSSHTDFLTRIVTSNKNYYIEQTHNAGPDSTQGMFTFSIIADMDAADTMTMTFDVSGSSKVVLAFAGTFLQGALLH
jgi:hypothetical protein